MTTIKVPTELRDWIAEPARNRRETMAEEEEFWAQARATMGTAAARADLRRERERFSTTPADELDPEDWSDIL